MRDNLPNCIENLIIDLSNQKQINNHVVNQVIAETEFKEKELQPISILTIRQLRVTDES